MPQQDVAFRGSIPAIYEHDVVPMYFTPYAGDLCARLAAAAPRRILEIAAGTGAVTRELRDAFPRSEIVATDLNDAMLDVAQGVAGGANVAFRQADAGALPFEDASFDAVVCQFGVMFFPDKPHAFREARRVLAPGGRFLFNVWDRLEACAFALAATEALAELYPGSPPTFFRRVPHGYYDEGRIRQDLEAAGFTDIGFDAVERQSASPSPMQAARGLCEGTPLRAEIEALKSPPLEEATRRVAEIFERRFGQGEIDGPMRAVVVTARKS